MAYVWDKGLLKKLNEPAPAGIWGSLSFKEGMLAAEAMLEPVDDLSRGSLWRRLLKQDQNLFIAVLMFGNAALRIREAVGMREEWERTLTD